MSEVNNKHYLFKKIVEEVGSTEIIMSLNNGESVEKFLDYIVTSNVHMYHTIDNFEVLATFINEVPDIRDLIFNITDKVIFEYIGSGGDVKDIVNYVIYLVTVTKNIGVDKKLYDSRIADSLMFDEDKLRDLLVSNVYLIVIYYMVTYPYSLFNEFLEEIEADGHTSKKV